MPKQFFEDPIEQSSVKGSITSLYFYRWANIILGAAAQRDEDTDIAYVELFSGPGRYRNGRPSTPVMVMTEAARNPKIAARITAIFVEEREDYVTELRQSLARIEGIDKLRHAPKVIQRHIDVDISEVLTEVRHLPTFSFVDPFGYEGLTQSLIKLLIEDWGSDCIFFFNYNRIRPALQNPKVERHINQFFGEERAKHLRSQIVSVRPAQSERQVVEKMVDAVKEVGGTFVLPFKFRSEKQNRTSHYLVFVSKHVKGLKIMKEVMAKFSTNTEQGVPSMEHGPTLQTGQMYLIPLSEPISELKASLLSDFASQSLRVGDVIDQHTAKTRCLERNYKDALLELEAEGEITIDPPAEKRRKRRGKPTLANDKLVKFP